MTDAVRILLLENIHPDARANLEAEGFEVELLKKALPEDELCERIKGVSAIGIRSKTVITPRVLESADRLRAVGAFCIGTNQIALEDANKRGIPAFNAPFSNTRSVAEMINEAEKERTAAAVARERRQAPGEGERTDGT